MDNFLSLLSNWHFWVLVVVYWLLTASIGALPMPDTTSSKFYGWFFKMSNTFAANISRVAASTFAANVERDAASAFEANIARDANASKIPGSGVK
jgi:hypothetical protein